LNMRTELRIRFSLHTTVHTNKSMISYDDLSFEITPDQYLPLTSNRSVIAERIRNKQT